MGGLRYRLRCSRNRNKGLDTKGEGLIIGIRYFCLQEIPLIFVLSYILLCYDCKASLEDRWQTLAYALTIFGYSVAFQYLIMLTQPKMVGGILIFSVVSIRNSWLVLRNLWKDVWGINGGSFALCGLTLLFAIYLLCSSFFRIYDFYYF